MQTEARSRMTLSIAILVALGAHLSAQETVQPMRPPLPFFQWNSCPFEGCVYRRWKAEAPVPLYSTWKRSRREVGELVTGETVIGMTGVVITFKPGRIRLDRDLPDHLDLKRGEIILTYAYRGEGETTAWCKGHFYESFDITFARDADGGGCAVDCFATVIDAGRKEWWAKVKLTSGRTAWVLMDNANFSGVDVLG